MPKLHWLRANARPVRALSGFTLIEVLVVLVMGIIVLGVGAVGVAKALESSKVRTEARNLNELISVAQSLRSPSGYPTGMIVLLRQMRKLPPAFADLGGNELVNSWGGALTLDRDGYAGFRVELTDIPNGPCVHLAATMAKGNHIGVEVAGTPLGNSSMDQVVDAAGDLCTSDTNNTLSLIYNN